jgi:hypothetical protein
MYKYVILVIAITTLGTLACETDNDCLHEGKCLNNTCDCDFLWAGDSCQEKPLMGLWIVYIVYGCLGHLFIILFALYQLRIIYSSKTARSTTNMVTVELYALILASLRKYDNTPPKN